MPSMISCMMPAGAGKRYRVLTSGWRPCMASIRLLDNVPMHIFSLTIYLYTRSLHASICSISLANGSWGRQACKLLVSCLSGKGYIYQTQWGSGLLVHLRAHSEGWFATFGGGRGRRGGRVSTQSRADSVLATSNASSKTVYLLLQHVRAPWTLSQVSRNAA